MAFDYINEAFKKLDALEEKLFDTSLNGINELSDFMNKDDTDEILRVIDPEAETEDELQDSYVGKVIINCNVCHSHIFENKEEIKIEEDGAVNIESQCPYCGEQEGFIIVGEIAPYTNGEQEQTEVPTEADTSEESDNSQEDIPTESEGTDSSSVDVEEVTDPEDVDELNENKPLRLSRATRRTMQEEFKEVTITTDDQHMEMTADDQGKVTVTTEPVSEQPSAEEIVVPVSDETEEEILDNNDAVVDSDEEQLVDASAEDNSATDEASEDNTDVEIDFEDVDEEGINELGESYFNSVYENVESFKTTSVAANNHALIVEGLITFSSGVQKKTGFIFEAKDVNTRGQVRFSGYNKHLCESTDAFSLVGTVDNKKLFVESLKYNYQVNNESVRGLIRRK